MTGLGTPVHRRSAALLRRWLAETHTPVRAGVLRLSVGPLVVQADVAYCSPTGGHGFRSISVLDKTGDPCDAAEPALLAAAFSAEARARAVSSAPVNAADAGSLVDWAMLAAVSGARDPLWLDEAARPALAVTERDAARRWLDEYVRDRVVPAARAAGADATQVTIEVLTRGALSVIGFFGRHGVADEHALLDQFADRLEIAAQARGPGAELIRHWLDSASLTELSAVNGSQLRYADRSCGARPKHVRMEVPNPLRGAGSIAADYSVSAVPGVFLPAELGEFTLRPVRLTAGDGGADVTTVHQWMNTEHVAVHWNQAWPREQWRSELATQLDGNHSVPCLVSRGGREFAYVELYRVVRDKLAGTYPADEHDLGVHIALGERGSTGLGLGSTLLRTIAEGLLAADPRARRVVAEPDVRNAASVRAFGKAGFERLREVGLPTKNSELMVFERR